MQTPSDGYGEKPYQKNNRLNDYKRITRKNNKRLTIKRNKLKTASMPDSILMMNVSCRFLLIEWANLQGQDWYNYAWL